MLKRTFDLMASALLLLVLSPLLLALLVLVWHQSGGSPLFRHRRVGRCGRRFDCLKFRTMRMDAEQTLARWKADNHPLWQQFVANGYKLPQDPRVTPVGRWLRASSLDELPQLWNVLVGDMSLVGPRPLTAEELQRYGSAARLYLQVRPGITGLWQISGRSNTTFAQRIALDSEYAQRCSLWLDLRILLATPAAVLSRRGAC